MGKVVGLIGSVSGKVGNVVYAVSNGIQIARVYQPNVANPRTKGQTDHRLKVALAGRLSKIVDGTALVGFLGNARQRRGKFIANVIRNISVTLVDGVSTAKVTLPNIAFSEGNLEPYSTPFTTTAIHRQDNPNYIDITIPNSPVSGVAPAGYGEKVVLLLIDAESSQFDYAIVVDRSLTAATNVTVRVADSTRAYTVATYLIPYAVNTKSVSSGSTYLGTEGNAVAVNDMISNKSMFDFGASLFNDAISVQPPASRESDGIKGASKKK